MNYRPLFRIFTKENGHYYSFKSVTKNRFGQRKVLSMRGSLLEVMFWQLKHCEA